MIRLEPRSIDLTPSEPTWSILDVLTSEQAYTSRNWNFEKSWRIILKSKFGIVEASYFQHSKDGRDVKSVIELPVSYGCPIGCGHCASGDITRSRNLTARNLYEIYSVVKIFTSTLRNVRPEIIAFSGIGECSINSDALFNFCRIVDRPRYSKQFIITTVGTKADFISDVELIAADIDVRWLQISLLHHDRNVLVERLGAGFQKFDLHRLIERIMGTKSVRVRLNYVVINGFNSDPIDIVELSRQIGLLRNKVTIRVSQLNETGVSRKNGLKQPSPDAVLMAARTFQTFGFDAYAFMSSYNDNMNCGQLAWIYR